MEETFFKCLEWTWKAANWIWGVFLVVVSVPFILFCYYIVGGIILNLVLGIPVLAVFFLSMIIFGPGAVHDFLEAFVRTRAGHVVMWTFHIACVPTGIWWRWAEERARERRRKAASAAWEATVTARTQESAMPKGD